jgi:hypothetical protein
MKRSSREAAVTHSFTRFWKIPIGAGRVNSDGRNLAKVRTNLRKVFTFAREPVAFGRRRAYTRALPVSRAIREKPEIPVNRARHGSVRGLAALALQHAAARFAAGLAGLALIAGCSHPCGYVDIRSVLTPLGAGRVANAPLEQPLRITREVSERNAVLEVRVEGLETTEGPAQLERFGKPACVPWRWYHPLVKLPIAVTIFPPFFLAFHDPTTYGGGNWTRWDYFRDVGAWFNLCSAVPIDARKARGAEERILMKTVVAVVRERRAPISGRGVTLSLDGRKLAGGVSDAEGAVRFDLASFLTPELVQSNHTLRIVSLSDTGEAAELSRKLDGKTVQQFLENRPAAPQSQTPPP